MIKPIIGALLLSICSLQVLAQQPLQKPVKKWKFSKKPVWSDEFNQNGKPDPAKWSYQTGGNGWGNNELQYYTEGDNVHIEDGKLVITARKEAKGSNQYTSTRLVSKNKGDFLYGRIEVKAKIPKGVGSWPAIWMMPTSSTYGGWPASGEIDIMEHVGYDQDMIHQSVHTKAFNHVIKTQKTAFKLYPGVSEQFFVYRIDWTPETITGYVNNDQLFQFANDGKGFESWPFDKPFYLLLNIAVGGNWGAVKGVDDSIFPLKMEVDYVRVYQLLEK
jgi:beta-glucanase (GH16 family)